jgi:outer membrane protein TolC
MNYRQPLCLLAVFALINSAWAEAMSDLPPLPQVTQALRQHPLVQAAAAGVRSEQANRDRLLAGTHETLLSVASQRRRERGLDMSTMDHEIRLERPLRLPGKSAKDAELGAVGVAQSQNELGDAMHESARLLLQQWFAWQRETVAVSERAAQFAQLEQQHAVVLKRVTAGDAPRMETLLSEAQLLQAQSVLAETKARQALAANSLLQQFPNLELPASVVPSSPQLLTPPDDGWRAQILIHNHELAVARNIGKRASVNAQLLDAERVPDPTVGLKFGRERDGQERIFGLQLTIPLPGSGRGASARAGAAQADAALAREVLVLRRVEAEAAHTISQLSNTQAQWQRHSDIAVRMEQNAALLEKAWRAGEGQFLDVQMARRQANEARLSATLAQLDANEARYRLQLDTHALWEFDAEAAP